MQQTSIKLIKLLKENGFEAYWAGGCVRDMLLGKDPQDYDIVTNAKPEQIEKIVAKTIPVGKQFGVILAVEKGHHFEIATFRSDSGYSDGRRPDAVFFTSAEEDAKRRDFSINGIFFDPIQKKVLDYVEGLKDLNAKLIKFIGDPEQRINEDHLRIIRAIRLKNSLNFGYHPDTYAALKKYAHLAAKVSGERLREEMNKILLCDHIASAFEDMQDTGVLKVIIPEIEAMKGIAQPMMYHEEGDVWTHTMLCLQSLPKHASLNLRYATLFHDIGKPVTFKLDQQRIRFDGHAEAGVKISAEIMHRLKFAKKDLDVILWLIEHHMMLTNFFKMRKGRRMHWFLKSDFPQLLELFKADIKGARPLDDHIYQRLQALYHKEIKKVPREPKRLLSGDDIMKKLKLTPSKQIGEILFHLREAQLAGKIKTKKQANQWLKTYKIKN